MIQFSVSSLRKRLKMTQSEFADALNVSRATITRAERHEEIHEKLHGAIQAYLAGDLSASSDANKASREQPNASSDAKPATPAFIPYDKKPPLRLPYPGRPGEFIDLTLENCAQQRRRARSNMEHYAAVGNEERVEHWRKIAAVYDDYCGAAALDAVDASITKP